MSSSPPGAAGAASPLQRLGQAWGALLPEERRAIFILIPCLLVGAVNIFFGIVIPYVWNALMGVIIIAGVGALYREVVLLHRPRHLLIAILQPPVTLLALYVNYISLAEALDKDSYSLATEDDLEQDVERHYLDRLAAQLVLYNDLISVILSFAVADHMLTCRRVYLGLPDNDQPWLLQLAASWQYERYDQKRQSHDQSRQSRSSSDSSSGDPESFSIFGSTLATGGATAERPATVAEIHGQRAARAKMEARQADALSRGRDQLLGML